VEREHLIDDGHEVATAIGTFAMHAQERPGSIERITQAADRPDTIGGAGLPADATTEQQGQPARNKEPLETHRPLNIARPGRQR